MKPWHWVVGLMNFELNSHIQTLLKRSGCAEMFFVAKRKTIQENPDHPMNRPNKTISSSGSLWIERYKKLKHTSFSSMIRNDAFAI